MLKTVSHQGDANLTITRYRFPPTQVAALEGNEWTITSVGEKLEPSDSEWEGKTGFGKVWQFLKQRGLPPSPVILVLSPKRSENMSKQQQQQMLMAALSQRPRSENNPDVQQLISGQTT